MVVDDDIVHVATLREAEIGLEISKGSTRKIGCKIFSNVLGQTPRTHQAFLDRIRKDYMLEETFVKTIMASVVSLPKGLKRGRPVIWGYGLQFLE